MKRFYGKFLFACSILFLLGSGKFPPPSVTPKQPDIAPGGRAAAIAVHPGNENNSSRGQCPFGV